MTSTAICGSICTFTTATSPRCRRATFWGTSSWARSWNIGSGCPHAARWAIEWWCPLPSHAAAATTAPSQFYSALRQLESERIDGAKRCTASVAAAGCSAIRTCTADIPAARRSTCACRSPTSDRSRSKTALDDEQVLFLSDIFPTGYMAAENCSIQTGRCRGGMGLRPGRAVRDKERVPARSRAGDLRSIGSPPGSGSRRLASGSRDDQLRRGITCSKRLKRAYRRPRDRMRASTPSGWRHTDTIARRRVRPGEDGHLARRPIGLDALRQAISRVPKRRNGLGSRRLRRISRQGARSAPRSPRA